MFRSLPAWKLLTKATFHENAVHRLNDGRRRAIGLVEFAQLVGATFPFAAKDADIPITPAVDRLLRIADDKDRLLSVTLGLWASTEEELLRGGVGLGVRAAGVLCGAVRTKD